MNYTFATIIINDNYRAQAQADLGEGFFNTPLSTDGNKPPVAWLASGPFLNEELNKIFNVYTWEKKVYFGDDWVSALEEEGLKIISENNNII